MGVNGRRGLNCRSGKLDSILPLKLGYFSPSLGILNHTSQCDYAEISS